LAQLGEIDDAHHGPAASLQRLQERLRDVFVDEEWKSTGHSVAGLNTFALGVLPELLVFGERSIDLLLVV
jgi:hypothetical protein